MSLLMQSLVLGPLENNTYLVADDVNHEAAVIDPSHDSREILLAVESADWKLKQIWLTHAHFDHINAAVALARSFTPALPIALHRADYPLWQQKGGGVWFGIDIDISLEPSLWVEDNQELFIGGEKFIILHTPGHTAGHVVFYHPVEKRAFCGDVIFFEGIGRTDLPGGDYETLIDSIQRVIFALPAETHLYPGHGSATTVAHEKLNNPFLG